MSNSELDEINRLRVSEGLPPIEPATVRCLRCDAEFESWDKRNNRVCNECKSDDEFNSQCEVYNLPERFIKQLPRSKAWLDRHIAYFDTHYGDGYVADELLDTTLMDREDL